MFNTIDNFVRPALIASSLLGSYLTLIPMTAVQAQTPVNSQKIAQLPDIQYQEFQANPTAAPAEYDWNSQYSQTSESYLVIVDSNDSGLLQQVRMVEPTAFVNRYQGRSVIRAGLFKRLNNAQERVRQLQVYGISSRLYSQSNGREIANSYGGFNSNSGNVSSSNMRNSNRRTKYYYVAIPDNPNRLFQIENQIRQSVGGNSVNVTLKNSPRGPHVAVGPFGGRSQAEQWNYYLRSLGLNNARVYYGK